VKRGFIAKLTPASGRQDHTTSPSALAPFVNAPPKRPSHPAPNVRDDRDTPLFSGAGWREVLKMICPTAKAKYLRQGDWTVDSALIRFGKFGFWRNRIYKFGGSADRIRAEQRPVLPPRLRRLLVEPVTDEGEQLGGFKDHVIDEVHERCEHKQERHAARDLNRSRGSREVFAAPSARVASGDGEGGGGWVLLEYGW
jgi:hypothetical protein